MLFETLLLQCLMRGMSLGDSGGRISLNLTEGETGAFFKLDNRQSEACLRVQGEICDGLVLYTRKDEKIFCLAELKGKNTDHAVEQILNTYKYLKMNLHHIQEDIYKSHWIGCTYCKPHISTCTVCKKQVNTIRWKAYIYQRGASPEPIKPSLVKELKQTFGEKGYAISHDSDIGKFLRR